jgi:hypothetical protein
MILSYYGKRLIVLYNEKHKTEHTAKSFFEEKLFPIVYQKSPPLNRYAHNSKFRYADTPEEGLVNFHQGIEKKEFNTGSVFGFAATDPKATTAGQVTDLAIPVLGDDAYASWIADALSIDVEGSTVLIEHPDIFLWLQEGWQEYRALLDQTPNPTPQQIRKWNAAYLAHKINDHELLHELHYKVKTTEILAMNWVKLVVLLAKLCPNQSLTCYAYILDKSGNTTIGFIPIYLPQIASMYKVYNELFANNAKLPVHALESLISTYRFKEVCERGYIGLYALEPKGIREFIGTDKLPDPNKQYSNPFHLYQLWIIAMLEDKNLLQYAKDVALTMNTFVQGATQKSNVNTRSQIIKDVLATGSLQKLVAQLNIMLEAEPSLYEPLIKLIEIVYKQTADQLRLFLTLIKFHYVGISQNEQTDLFNN